MTFQIELFHEKLFIFKIMNCKKKVLFLIPSLNSGGIETYLLRFLRFMKVQFVSTVIVRNPKEGDLFTDYKTLGIAIEFMPLGYYNSIKWIMYYRYFRKNSFDCICDFNANFAGIPLWIARIAGIRNRIAFYRQGKDHFKQSVVKKAYNNWVNKLVYQNATHILSNSQSAIEYFFPYRNIADKRFLVISNGVDAEIFKVSVNKADLRSQLNLTESAFVVGHSGRLDKAKNHVTILKVAQILISKDQNIYFIFCGKDTENLQKQVDELGLTANVRLLGYRKDVSSLLKIMDLFYFPSITEGQPNALIEAMICGLPFIASDIAPIKETAPIELFSWLVDPMEIAGVVELVLRFKENSHQQIKLMETCTNKIVEKYNAERNFNEFFKIIKAQ